MDGADLTAAERRVLEAVDEDELVETLVELVRVPSVTGTDAEAELQHTMARWYEEAGLEVDLWSLDLEGLRADPEFPGTEAPRLEGYGVVGTGRARAVRASSCKGTSTSSPSATSPHGPRQSPTRRASRTGACTAGAPAT